MVVNTWPFVHATLEAWNTLRANGSAVDAVISGCSSCERLQCDGTVGFGGSPDEKGETTLDAMVIDGTTLAIGAVGGLKSVKDAIATAALVSRHTEHTLLVGAAATQFAAEMGLQLSNLTTEHSMELHDTWLAANCQPNFWKDVVPPSDTSCGPYTPKAPGPHDKMPLSNWVGRHNHDTIAMLAMDMQGNIAAGTSTNGASNKIAGRVGDAAIPGAGAYAVTGVGACGATGDGDFMMRFLPCYQAVENMRHGMSPTQACEEAMRRILHYVGSRPFQGALVAMDSHGRHGGAASGWQFQYAVASLAVADSVQVVTVDPLPRQPAEHQERLSAINELPLTS